MIVNNNAFMFIKECELRSKTWFDIGKLIYNLSNGSPQGYRLWVMYSKIDWKNFDEFYCKEYWNHLHITIEFY